MHLHTIARVALLTFLTTIPWIAGIAAPELRGHDFARIAQVVLFSIGALAVTSSLSCQRTVCRTHVLLSCAVVALAGASTIASSSYWAGGIELATLAGAACISVVAARLAESQRNRLFASSLAIGLAAQHALAAILIIAALAGGHLELLDSFPGFDNYRFFNHVQTLTVPLLAYLAGRTDLRRSVRACAWFALVAGMALIVLTAARATLVSQALAGVLLLVLVRTPEGTALLRRLTIALVVGMALAAPLHWSSTSGEESAQGPSSLELTSDHSRLYLWRIAFDNIAESPWSGIGPMQYADRANAKAAHPHNLYLQTAAELGLPLLAIGLVAAALCISKLVAACRRAYGSNGAAGAALLMSLTAAAIDGAFSGNFVMPVSQVWIAVVAGWCLAWYSQQATTLPTSETVALTAGRRWLLIALLLASQALLVARTAWTFPSLQRSVEASGISGPQHRLKPRYWSDGSY